MCCHYPEYQLPRERERELYLKTVISSIICKYKIAFHDNNNTDIIITIKKYIH